MSACVAHRGPDADGVYHSVRSADQSVSLGIRRLSIMDPGGGDQPQTHRSATVVFNGEIYNDADLRKELASAGAVFNTGSDTEVILHGYHRWGFHQLLQRLNGMFAFAIHDAASGELLLARDRTGQKPLYYAKRSGKLLFASEIKALLESELVERKLNRDAVDQYLTLRYVTQPETLLAGVYVLPAGHSLRWNEGQLTIAQYWHPPVVDESTQSESELLEEWTDLFDAAVQRTLRSDVPVGSYLSGGVDSSLLVATMKSAQADGLPFSGQTYSLGFGTANDETNDAARLASSFGIENRRVQLDASSLAELPRILWHLERPIGEPLIVAYDALARTASQDVKAVFSGEGADELFAGYSFHRVLQSLTRVGRIPGSTAAVSLLLKSLPVAVLNRWFSFPAYLGQAGKDRVVSFAAQFGKRHLGQNYAALRTLFDVPQRHGLYSNEFRVAASEEWLHQPQDVTARPLERLLNLQYHDWLQDFALLRQDKLSMAHGLEVRLPFLDNTLIDFAAKLPAHCKLNGRQNKVLLRQLAASRLPTEYALRRKQAFYFPLESMYRHEAFQDMLAETLSPDAIAERGIFNVAAIEQLKQRVAAGEFLLLKQLMSLVILELWMQIFLDNQRSW
jgi:asparagine synthase (glutamine-hydrolysing)